jgi:pimeloyl-ACP methyl ester carboxylesterase
VRSRQLVDELQRLARREFIGIHLRRTLGELDLREVNLFAARSSVMKMPISFRLTRNHAGRLLVMAIGISAACVARADDLQLPRSLSEAIKMERADALPRTSFYESSSLATTKPGDLLRQAPFSGYAVPDGARTVRILYHSLDATGTAVATSGVVLIPAGKPPTGGWPVIAWAHGTSGVARQCAPSLEKDMTYGEEGLMPMVRAGFAVVATDYHGLGTLGPHQYINKTAQGRDVIYSIPAARKAVPELASKWVVIGHSQGGVAAWSVAEMEATLRDPNYLGAISVSGAADLRQVLAQMSKSGRSAAFYLTYMAYAIKAMEPRFQPSEMLTADVLHPYQAVTTAGCWYYAYATFLDAPAGDALKPGWDQSAAAQQFFHNNELGTAPISGPLFVIGGEADETVPFSLLRATAQKACRNGIALTFRSYPGLDHDPTMEKSTPDQLAWVRDRMANKPAINSCASLVP